jgi:glycosyltransferase involved in cell wall biosynthesis
VEVCISDNNSTDDTEAVINRYRSKLKLKTQKQIENIGGTRNFIAVSAMATGKWIMLIGDDDDLNIENFTKLMILLKLSNATDWVLVGVEDDSRKEILIGNIMAGRYDAKLSRTMVLHTGLYRYGFIGMHVFPAIVKPKLQEMAGMQEVIEKRLPWPHIYLFLKHIQTGNVQIFPGAVVKQAPNNAQLFWNIGDWCYVNLLKISTISLVRKSINDNHWFFYKLMLRELYSLRNVKELLLWKLLEPVDFRRRLIKEIFPKYKLLGLVFLLSVPHALLSILLWLMPNCIYTIILKNVRSKEKNKNYKEKKKLMERLNALKRGI